MSTKERRQLEVMQRIGRGELSRRQGADLLSISDRQVYRIYDRYRRMGDRGVVHRSRGGHSSRAYPLAIRNKVLLLYKESYADYGPTLLSEEIQSQYGLRIGHETVRRWLIDAGLWHRPTQGRRSRKHRKARARRTEFGAMIQLDGSEHNWFEGRNPELPMLTLLVMIDDATSRVFLRFASEDRTGVFTMIRDYARQFGLPQSIYTDFGAVYGTTKTDQSQYKRAMSELGVQVIQAYSPQAKGRVERCNRTLQDRLVKALRKHHIQTVEEANRFLDQHFTPDFNSKFSRDPLVLPVQTQPILEAGQPIMQLPRLAETAKTLSFSNAHRAVDNDLLHRALALEVTRIVRNDYTISLDGKLYQIDRPRINHRSQLLPAPGATVSIRVCLEQEIYLVVGQSLAAPMLPLQRIINTSGKLGITGRNRIHPPYNRVTNEGIQQQGG